VNISRCTRVLVSGDHRTAVNSSTWPCGNTGDV